MIYEILLRNKEIKFPKNLDDKSIKKLISQLLNKGPELRLGGSFAALKNNRLFNDFDWDSLVDKTMDAPFKPNEEKVISHKQINELKQKASKLKDHFVGLN